MNILLIGANGNVGRGIAQALQTLNVDYFPIDPTINYTFADIPRSECTDLLTRTTHIIYTADSGNRDEYENNPHISQVNQDRFQQVVETCKSINPHITIWYVGGSWTKRQPSKGWIVSVDSPNKALSECNAYERSKIEAEQHAQLLSQKHNIKIRYIDYISIVPNVAPNFSICKMVKEAFEEHSIHYSDGPYGRPLLTNIDAGKVLIQYIQKDSMDQLFYTVLIPGIFISFKSFAEAVYEIIIQKLHQPISLIPISTTPEFLKTTIDFSITEKEKLELQSHILESLKENAEQYFKNLDK